METQSNKLPRLYQRIAEKLIAKISSGEYVVGDRLPSERELASIYNISRPTVREAMIALEIEKYIEVRMGSGVHVIDRVDSKRRFSDSDIGPFELTEARALFEGEAAALAATMITDDELKQLSETLVEMKTENEGNNSLHEEADKKFHMIIANATNNNAIITVIESLWNERETSIVSRRIYEKVRNVGVKPSIEEHRKIYLALKSRDAQLSRELMRAHLMRVIDGLLEATEVEAVEAARSKVTKSRERFNKSRLSN